MFISLILFEFSFNAENNTAGNIDSNHNDDEFYSFMWANGSNKGFWLMSWFISGNGSKYRYHSNAELMAIMLKWMYRIRKQNELRYTRNDYK